MQCTVLQEKCTNLICSTLFCTVHSVHSHVEWPHCTVTVLWLYCTVTQELFCVVLTSTRIWTPSCIDGRPIVRLTDYQSIIHPRSRPHRRWPSKLHDQSRMHCRPQCKDFGPKYCTSLIRCCTYHLGHMMCPILDSISSKYSKTLYT